MRNLKKILALVLALVMVVGMMGIASAAVPGTSYADDADITKFDESIQILTALGIYEGTETGSFNPNATITRAEVATLIYRVVTQDTTGKYVNIYSDYNQFADVDSSAWYAGYVNFCANGGYLKGDGTNFYPMEKVTGYQVLAILLRVIGYGMEGEYEGTNWHIRTASKAAELGITKNITAGTLGAYSTRAMVAEMIYRGIAQTETVSYNRVTLYVGTESTYAYANFGLHGDISQTERSKAVIDNKYDEPVAYWAIYGDADAIAIRFNPKGTWTNTVTDSTLFAAGGYTGYTETVYNYSVDGEPNNTVKLEKSEYYSPLTFGGKGVVVELYVADGRTFIVEKNTYVDIVNVGACVQGKAHYDLLSLVSGKPMHKTHWYTDLANKTVVIYNMYNGKVDNYTIKAANKTAVTVTNTYDTGYAANSYFIAGQTYQYNDNYCNWLNSGILNRDDEGFTASKIVYTDDYGYVVYVTNPGRAANETGYVLVRHGAYGGNIADNRWVGNFTVIHSDGSTGTVRGAINTGTGYYTTQAAASDAKAAELGLYAYEIIGGYYNLVRVDNAATTHFTGKLDLINTTTTTILAGDADALDPAGNALIHDNTLFIIANYDATGAISGYNVVKGFKNIPDMTGITSCEVVLNAKTIDVELVFVQGAVQSANTVGTALADVSFFLLDTTPEDYVVTYDKHTVIMGGNVTTMNFVPNFVSDGKINGFNTALPNGMYYVTGTTNGYVSSVAPYLTWTMSYAADGVMAYSGYNTKGEYVEDFLAMADNCVVYAITSSGVVALDADEIAELDGVVGFNTAYDAYGFATVIYVVL